MEIKAKTRTGQILMVMHVLAWIAFIGYIVKAGAVLISFGVSIANPDAAKNLYETLNLYNLRQVNFWYYTGAVSFIVTLTLMKSSIWFLVIKALSNINVLNPFKMDMALRLEKISYILFATWLVAMMSAGYSGWVVKRTGELAGDWTAGEFIFMAGLVFIISQVFKRGVEIQSENELTV